MFVQDESEKSMLVYNQKNPLFQDMLSMVL